ncbi:putative transcription factor B3-Domain family [Helianthus anomalus]
MIHHQSQRSWQVSLRSVSGESVIIDGWGNVVRDLELIKRTFLLLRIIEDKNIEIDCFVENICGESFVTVNRYGVLKIIVSILTCLIQYLFCYTCQLNGIHIYLTIKCYITFQVIPEAYITNCYSYSPVNDSLLENVANATFQTQPFSIVLHLILMQLRSIKMLH